MKCYLRFIDLSKESFDPKSELFIETCFNYDILGGIQAFAKRNGTEMNDIRAYVCENRKEWNNSREWWTGQVDWRMDVL